MTAIVGIDNDHGNEQNHEERMGESRKKLETLLLESLDSGDATPWTEQDREEILREVQKRLATNITLP